MFRTLPRLLLLLACLLLHVGTATAQGPASAATPALKDGAYRLHGVVMRLQAGQSTRLSAPMKFSNGLTLRTDGIMVGKDGSRQLLEEGKAINMQGQIVNFRDDMMSAAAIERHDNQVTGYTPTVIEGRTQAPVSPEILASLRRTEARLAVLQQLAARLNERASAALGSSTQSAALDAQLRELDARRP